MDSIVGDMSHRWLLLRGLSVLLFVLWIFFVNRQVNKGQLSFLLGAVWTTAFFVATISALFPNLLRSISSLLGVIVPANILFFASIIFLIVLCFGLTLKSSLHNRQLIRLAQDLALLQTRLPSPSPGSGSEAKTKDQQRPFV